MAQRMETPSSLNVQLILAPELTAGGVVIMDNLPAHKVTGMRQAIEAAV